MAKRSTKTDLTAITPTQAEAILKDRDNRSKDELYDSLRIADHLLTNEEFMANFDGKYDNAVDHLENKYFGIARQVMRLDELLTLFRRFSEAEWKEYDFDMRAMYSLAMSKDEGEGEKRERTNYVQLLKNEQVKVAILEEELKKAHVEIAKLNADLRDTKAERDGLKLRVEALERDYNFLRGQLSKAAVA